MNGEFSWLIALLKGLKYWVVLLLSWGVGTWIASNPTLANMPVVSVLTNALDSVFGKVTLGALLLFLVSVLKNKLGLDRIP